MKHYAWIIPILGLAVLAGCGRLSSGGNGGAATHTAPRKVVVCVDVSGSYYARVKRALEFLAKLFKVNARPGDIWVFRTITVGSYADEAGVPVYRGRAHVHLPTVAPAPQNPYNRKGRERHLKELQAFEQTRDAVVQSIQKLKLRIDTDGTDIYGALRKAADLKATHIVLFTDLEDTEKRRTNIDLHSATVYVVLLHREKVEESVKRQEQWKAEFKQMNAGEVVFIDLDHEPPQL
jgi:hypothetical protein